VSKVCPDGNCDAVSDEATPELMARGLISDDLEFVEGKSYQEAVEVAVVG
jgi:hypothetical protein